MIKLVLETISLRNLTLKKLASLAYDVFSDMLACLMLFGFIRVGQKLIFDPQGLQEKIEVEKITKRAGLEG